MNIYIEVHTWTYGLNSLKCIPRSGTAGSNDVCPWHSWTTNPVLCRDFPSMPHWYYPLLLTSSGHWKVSCDSFIPLSVVWPFSLAAFRIILIFNVQACVSRHGLIFISMWDLFFFLNPLNVISFLLAPLPPSGIPDICWLDLLFPVVSLVFLPISISSRATSLRWLSGDILSLHVTMPIIGGWTEAWNVDMLSHCGELPTPPLGMPWYKPLSPGTLMGQNGKRRDCLEWRFRVFLGKSTEQSQS